MKGKETHKDSNASGTLVLHFFRWNTSYRRRHLRRKEQVRRIGSRRKGDLKCSYPLTAVRKKRQQPSMEIVDHPQMEEIKGFGRKP